MRSFFGSTALGVLAVLPLLVVLGALTFLDALGDRLQGALRLRRGLVRSALVLTVILALVVTVRFVLR